MKKKSLIILLICLSFLLGTLSFTTALAKTENSAKSNSVKRLNNYSSRSAYLVDYDTGAVLFERNADAKYPIASMVKIMTLNIVFDEIESGRLSLDEKVVVSERSAGMGGSQMFLESGLEYSVYDLIKGVTVVSANDACVALAERICGSVEDFIDLMNERAVDYGMQNTRFVNVTGLPEDNQYSTAKDVSKMMKNLLKHQKYYDFSKIYLENFTHPDGRVTELTNTNKLVRFYQGCDAGKTGFTSEAMFCLSATAKRNDTRFIATVLGAESSKERNKEISDLFDFAFANYKTTKILEKGKPIESNLTIKGAKTNTFNLTVTEDVNLLSKKGATPNYEIKFAIDENLKAPIKQGEKVGIVRVINTENGSIIRETTLVTMEEIANKSYLDGLREILENWFLSA